MKRTKLDHKLHLDRTLIRTLGTEQLARIQGGDLPTSRRVSCINCPGDAA